MANETHSTNQTVKPDVVIPQTCPIHFLALLDDPDGSITGWGIHVLYCPLVPTGQCEYVVPVDH